MVDQTLHLWRRVLCAAVLAFAAASVATSPAHAAAPEDLVGTWRLVSFEDVEDGKIVRRFGEKPIGLFVYTRDGHVIIQISNPANPACLTKGKKSLPGGNDDIALPICTPEQMQTLLDGTVAYWGTYTVDMAAGVITHKVRSDVANGYAGTGQRRLFRLNGDHLVLGDGKSQTRVLERVGR